MYKIFTCFPQDKPIIEITQLYSTLHNHGFYVVSVFSNLSEPCLQRRMYLCSSNTRSVTILNPSLHLNSFIKHIHNAESMYMV